MPRYGVTVTGAATAVTPGVVSDVIEASEWYEPGFFEKMSKLTTTVPPGAGGVVLTSHSVPSAGADARFAPLDPVRFSAPQF